VKRKKIMLSKEDKYKIVKLRSHDFSYQKIHEKLGFSVDTVMKVCKAEEERKIKEMEGGQETSQTHKEAVSFDNSIDEFRKILGNIDDIIKKRQLKDEDMREWEKRKEDLQEMMRVEVDDRIDKERADAVEARNGEWRKWLEQNYVKKEVVTDLDKTIKTRDATILDLRNAIEEKDDLLRNNKDEMSQLKAFNQREKKYLEVQKGDLLLKNIGLSEDIGNLNDYIGNYLDDAGQWEREKLRREKEALNVEKTDFDRFVKTQESTLDELYFKCDEKLKDVGKREKQHAEKEKEMKKREEEFDKWIKQAYVTLEDKIKDVEKRAENVTELEKRLLRWKEEQKDEICSSHR